MQPPQSLGDKVQLLELRVQQLSGPVAQLTQQASEHTEKIATLTRLHVEGGPGSSTAGRAPTSDGPLGGWFCRGDSNWG
jgi:hypothetical protein